MGNSVLEPRRAGCLESGSLERQTDLQNYWLENERKGTEEKFVKAIRFLKKREKVK